MFSSAKNDAEEKQWVDAGLNSLRIVYYTYWEHLHHEPSDVYDMLKGYSYIVIMRGL